MVSIAREPIKAFKGKTIATLLGLALSLCRKIHLHTEPKDLRLSFFLGGGGARIWAGNMSHIREYKTCNDQSIIKPL